MAVRRPAADNRAMSATPTPTPTPTPASSPSVQITREVTSWPGVQAGPGRRGEFAFTVGGREIGHLHRDHAAHFGFPKALWAELFAAGRSGYPPVCPGRPGWAARRIDGDDDVRDVIALLRLNYDRAIARHGPPAPGGARQAARSTGGSVRSA